MNKRKTEIPVFATYEEAARFFDTHDLTGLDVEEMGWQIFLPDALRARPKHVSRLERRAWSIDPNVRG
jgi:hypothetical protein